MHLRLFFNPSIAATDSFLPSEIGSSIYADYDKMPSLKRMDIALIGINEWRGNPQNTSKNDSAETVREVFYRLKKSHISYRVADLGNLRLGETYDDTLARLREVCAMLLENNVLPLIIGGSHDLDFAQYTAYQSLDKLVYALWIDHTADLEAFSKPAAEHHILKSLVHQPNFLFSAGIIGAQAYLTDIEFTDVFEKLHFDWLSVGALRQRFEEVEPMIRSADMLSFDLSAVRRSDAPASKNSHLFGLSAEEACRIAWYTGTNEQLSSFGIYEYNADHDTDRQTAELVAVMLWYFVEGFYTRRETPHFRDDFRVRYVVTLPEIDVIFYKSRLSDRWWLQVPAGDANPLGRGFVVPCSYADFEQANEGNLPERLMKALARIA